MRSEMKIGLLVALAVVVVGAFVWNASRSSKDGGSVHTLPWDNDNRNSNTNSAAVHRPPAAQTPRTPANTVRQTPVTPPTGSPTNTTPPPPTAGHTGGNTNITPPGNPAVPPRNNPTLPPLGLLPESSSGVGTPERSRAEPNAPTPVPPGPTPGGPAPVPGGASVPTSMPSPRNSTPPLTGEGRPGPSVAVPPAGPLPPTSGTLPRARPDSLTPPSAGAGKAAKHKIAEGDTIWAIAEKYLGSGSRWPEIKAANPGLDEGRLLVGKEITIPAGAAAPANANPTTPPTARSNERPAPRGSSATPPPSGTTSGREGRPAPRDTTAAPRNGARPAPRVRAYTYKVEEGDSLVSIARNILKDGDRWREIYELNKAKIGKKPDVLFVGLEMKLPE